MSRMGWIADHWPELLLTTPAWGLFLINKLLTSEH
jgi:hypothetical protein